MLLIDDRDDEIRWLDIGLTDESLTGCTGVWVGDDTVHCMATAEDGRTILSVLDRRTCAVLDVGYPENVKDAHSVAVIDGDTYVVSTGTDEVRRLPRGRTAGPTEVVWQATTAGADTHHLNSILPVDGRLLCSAFGPKQGQRWSTALDGYVVDLHSGDIVCRGIEHPHSLSVGHNDLYIVESRRARIRSLVRGDAFSVEGYARGLAATADGTGVAGVSRGRRASRSLGAVENPADDGEFTGNARLVWFCRTHGPSGFRRLKELVLSLYGTEVYDVAVLAP
jgi:hypothetical protein